MKSKKNMLGIKTITIKKGFNLKQHKIEKFCNTLYTKVFRIACFSHKNEMS